QEPFPRQQILINNDQQPALRGQREVAAPDPHLPPIQVGAPLLRDVRRLVPPAAPGDRQRFALTVGLHHDTLRLTPQARHGPPVAESAAPGAGDRLEPGWPGRSGWWDGGRQCGAPARPLALCRPGWQTATAAAAPGA